ncbi:MAG: hypothetical protein RL021_1398 [Bacteroidota bacterium]|jgi:hypothetical protein
MTMHNQELIRGELADYSMGSDGILTAYSHSTRRTVESITRNLALVKTITGGKRVPLLLFLVDSPIPDAETRRFSAKKVGENYCAMAMVCRPGLGALVLRMVFGIKSSTIPSRIFTDSEKAKNWLLQFVDKNPARD